MNFNVRAMRGLAWEVWERMKLRSELRTVRQREPIIVYQMGKVGSSTVVNTLKHAWLPNPILHVHTLVKENLKHAIQKRRASPRPYLDEHLLVASELIKHRGERPFPCKLITLTREPISRAISFTFQDWASKAPDAQMPTGGLAVDAMTRAVDTLLRNGSGHADPSEWFDRELKTSFGIDVFTVPFDQQQGFSIVEGDGISLLILRMEDMNRLLPQALEQLLGINAKEITVQKANDGDAKWYSDSLKAVKDSFRVSEDLLEKILSSRYVRHFYASDIPRLRERWGK